MGEEQPGASCPITDNFTVLFMIPAGADSSEENVGQERRNKDRRIKKTQDLLHGALFSLIHDKPYDDISVKEILDRANVGRSTFYTHFRDKDELLFSSMRDMLGGVQSAALPSSANRHERIVAFSLPVFEHVYEHHRTGTVKMGTKGRAVLHGHLQKVLAEMIADNVGKSVQNRTKKTGRVSAELLVQYVAATFILVLNWWVESRTLLPPKEINNLLRFLRP